MKYVKKLRRLHTFYSMGTHNIVEGIAQLKELPQLRELLIGDLREESTITNAALKHIGQMKSLHILYIQSASVTDDGLIHLEKLPELNELTLTNTKVTPEAVKRLQSACPTAKSPSERADDTPGFALGLDQRKKFLQIEPSTAVPDLA